MEETSKIVCVGGHFNPLHEGHLLLIEQAKRLGDRLIVVVSNDIQARRKRPKVFMPLHSRLMILRSIKGVDEVVASIDTDSTIKNTLQFIRPDILASGCHANHKDATEERIICEQLGIETIYNVGGKKINSSSKILKEYAS